MVVETVFREVAEAELDLSVELRVELGDHRHKEVEEAFVGLLVGRHDAHLLVVQLAPTLQGQLNVAAEAGACLLQLGPQFSGEVVLEGRVAAVFKLGELHNGYAVRSWAGDRDAMLLQLVVRCKTGEELDLNRLYGKEGAHHEGHWVLGLVVHQ